MKRILFLPLCFIILLGCTQEKETQYSVDSEEVYLVITQNTTKEELVQIAAEFKLKRNIDIDFSKSQFSDEGKILDLDLKVDCNDGFKGSTAGSANSILLSNYGFRRDYTPESKVAFHIGAM